MPLLRYDHSTVSGRQIDAFLEQTGTAVSDNIWINFLDTMIALVAEGMGVALIPYPDDAETNGRVADFDLGVHTFHRQIGVLTRRKAVSREAEAFLGLLREEAKREPGRTQ